MLEISVNWVFLRMYSAGSTNRQLKARDGLWLCLAIALHALLLLIPVTREPASEPGVSSIIVNLLMEESLKSPFIEIIEPETPEIQTRQDEPVPVPAAEQPELTQQEEEIEVFPASPPVILSTAFLLQSASQIDWSLMRVEELRQLGIFFPRPVPENWRSGIGVEDNIFNGMVVPRKTEIVDRWLAADGSHNVVINTPTGDTFCGRALAWDPMQPLIEHVMQFRPCGGGGKRSFDMPQRQALPTNIIQMANSTNN
jgi:hypothetical protein